MTIVEGKTYRNEFNARRRVVAVVEDQVTFVLPLSGTEETASVAEFEAWQDGEYVERFPDE